MESGYVGAQCGSSSYQSRYEATNGLLLGNDLECAFGEGVLLLPILSHALGHTHIVFAHLMEV